MHKRHEIVLYLCRIWIMFLIALVGVICFFVFPGKRFDIAGSAILIAFSYFTVLNYPKGQLMESFILLGVLTLTICAYVFSENLNGVLFLPQLFYFFYGMGKFIFLKLDIIKCFKDFNWFWKPKSSKKKT